MENKSKKPVIYNLTLTVANTEYNQTLPVRTSRIQIQARNNNDVKVSFVSGQSGSLYFTIKGGMTYFDMEVMKSDGQMTIYCQSATALEICEILAWVDD